MKSPIETDAPAKLNLSLRVLGGRNDGFHEIDSLMAVLPGLRDSVRIEAADEDRFTCSDGTVPSDGRNLVIRARDLFRRETGCDGALTIHLEKRVPHGAGLGGGSSDAAATLRALDEGFGTHLGGERLRSLGAELGSDVPFFLGPPVARVGGRGERIRSGPDLPEMTVLLLKPSFGVSTPEAYRGWKLAAELPGVDYSSQRFGWGELINDLEKPVFQKHLFLAEIKMWLLRRAGVKGALMSGSGSTMFAVLESPELATGIAEAARRELDPTLWTWAGILGG